MSCFNCYFWTAAGCWHGIQEWPNSGPKTCSKFDYEPGTLDEA